jgi:DeoR/GlpR family transcriptional regulator of sugar metabolism
MIAALRHHQILDRLTRDGALSISRLAADLAVSRETIRRDVNELARLGRLAKARGGAVALQTREPDRRERDTHNLTGKRVIGRLAAGLVADGAALIIDSGSTTACLAEALAPRRDLTVLTPDLAIAQRLARGPGNRVFLLGGELSPPEGATGGIDAAEMLGRYRADLAFVGAGGLTPDGLLTDFTRDGAHLRGLMIRQAVRAYALVDHDKVGRTTPVVIQDFARAAGLVSDRALEPALGARLRAAGMDLLSP